MIIILMLKYKVKKASYAIFVDAVCRYMYVCTYVHLEQSQKDNEMLNIWE